VRQAQPITLQPAEVFVTLRPRLIRTLLGSCVAICLSNGHRGIGAMCHALLPSSQGATGAEGGRFVDEALGTMLRHLDQAGVKPGTLKARIFGGADMFQPQGSNLYAVGQRNIDMARTALDAAGIPVIGESTGGTLGRKVIFNTASGEVVVNLLRPAAHGREPAAEVAPWAWPPRPARQADGLITLPQPISETR
jgi:chemotaxis protein CheD